VGKKKNFKKNLENLKLIFKKKKKKKNCLFFVRTDFLQNFAQVYATTLI